MNIDSLSLCPIDVFEYLKENLCYTHIFEAFAEYNNDDELEQFIMFLDDEFEFNKPVMRAYQYLPEKFRYDEIINAIAKYYSSAELKSFNDYIFQIYNVDSNI